MFVTANVAAGAFALILNVTVTDAMGRRPVEFAGEKLLVILRVFNVTKQCSNIICHFNETLQNINLTSMQVNVSIYLLGVLVYEKSFYMENNSRIDLLAKVNASTIKIILSNDDGGFIKDCNAYVIGLEPKISALSVVSGQNVTLPFGSYNVSIAKCRVGWTSVPVTVPVLDHRFQVFNGTEKVSVRLGVAGTYKLEFRKADGSPLAGAYVKIAHVEAENATVFEGKVNVGYVTLSNLPYGRYLVTVDWQGETLLSRVIEVNGLQKGVNLTTNLLPLVTLTVLDADSRPIAGARLRIARAAGGAAAFDVVSDLRGQAVLSNVVPGSYIASSSWRNYTFSVPVHITGPAAEVRFPLRKVRLRVETEPICGGSCSLPPGLSAELVCGESLLAGASLAKASAELVVEPGDYVYVSAPLKLRIFWNGTKIFEKDVSADASVLSVALPFYNLSLKVVDASGRPLPNASLKIVDGLGVRAGRSDLEGTAGIGFVYGRRVQIEVFWGGVPVAKETVAVTPEPIEIRASVYTVKVEVVNALGQPVAGALLTARVKGLGYSFEQHAATRDDGAAELRLPIPSSAQVVLEVGKGRIHLVRQLLTEEVSKGATRVTLDLLLDLGPLQLRVGEFASLVAVAVAIALVVALVLRAWSGRIAARKIFEAYGGGTEVEEESEEASWRGILERFREVFGSERAEEEEEEEGLFDEL